MGVVLVIVLVFIVAGLIIYYRRSKEFSTAVNNEAKRAEDAIKEKLKDKF
jgi:uncharacterized membrane protein